MVKGLLTTGCAAVATAAVLYKLWQSRQKLAAFSEAQAAELAQLREEAAAAHKELEVELESCRSELQSIRTSGLSTHGLARGEVRGMDKMNDALFRLGALKHRPPSFRWIPHAAFARRAAPGLRALISSRQVFRPWLRRAACGQLQGGQVVRRATALPPGTPRLA